MVPTMPGIGADEISFLIEKFEERDACDRRAIGCAIARVDYSKLTRKLRIRRLSSQLNLSSGPTEAGSKSVDP
jgi:hypothetical protein